MARLSNRDRIARAAEEARLAGEEKLAKAKAKKKVKRPARSRVKEVRMRIVWTVHNAQGKPVKTFDYPQNAAAMIEARRLSSTTGHPHEVRATKIPME